MKISEQVSLIITTYNNPDFLGLVLDSINKQTIYPKEVIIADDGSTQETAQLIERYQKSFPIPVIHSWIPDEGFRVAKSRNMAIACSTAPYIIIIDGDIVVTSHFIQDHLSLMKEGQFVTGSRARLKKQATLSHIKERNSAFHFFSSGLNRRLVMLRIPFLHPLIKGHDGLKNARSCHMAFWKTDFIQVNGFEEAFEGWGFEDSEFVQRLFNTGLKRKNAKLLAPAVHLYHPEKSTENAQKNRSILNNTLSEHRTRAQKGVDQYL